MGYVLAGCVLVVIALVMYRWRGYFAEIRRVVDSWSRDIPDWTRPRPGSPPSYYYLNAEGAKQRTVSSVEREVLGQPWEPPTAYGVRDHPVAIAQEGLRKFDRHLATGESGFLAHALEAADELITLQQPDGRWLYNFSFIDLAPGWSSAMAQGQGASLLVRLYRLTSQPKYLQAASRAIGYMMMPMSEGGTQGHFRDGSPFLEEYPRSEVSPNTLNGSIFGLWGLYDYAKVAEDAGLMDEFKMLAEVVADHLDEYDTGDWTYYSLRSDRTHLADVRYHCVHVAQAAVMAALTGDERWNTAYRRWKAHYDSRVPRNVFELWWRDARRRIGVVARRISASRADD